MYEMLKEAILTGQVPKNIKIYTEDKDLLNCFIGFYEHFAKKSGYVILRKNEPYMFDNAIYILEQTAEVYGNFLLYSTKYVDGFFKIHWSFIIDILNKKYKTNIACNSKSVNFKNLILNDLNENILYDNISSIAKIRLVMSNNANNNQKLLELMVLECMIKNGNEDVVLNYLDCQYI